MWENEILNLDWVLDSYISYYVIIGLTDTCTMPLSPHEFVQISWKMICVATLHFLQLYLHRVPVTLYILGVSPSNWVNKMEAVVDSVMGSDSWKRPYLVVGSPLIRVDCCPCLNIGLDNGEKSRSISPGDNLHKSQGWLV